MFNIAAGTPCPQFSLPDEDGTIVTLDTLKGRPFVLYVYPKDDTPGCTTEALDFTALLPEFEAAGVAVFGVSPDTVQKHCRFRDKHKLSVRLLSDEDRSLIGALGLWVEKLNYGRRSMGVQRASYLFDADAKLVNAWPKVSVKGHAAEVLEAARALGHP